MKKTLRTAVALAFFATPLAAFAQTGINLTAIRPYSDGIINVINTILVPVLIAIAFIVFLWGVYQYFILGADDETALKTGRQFVLWGIIGFVVIMSVWGLVNLFRSTLGLSSGVAPAFPTIGTQTGTTGSNQSASFPNAGQGQSTINSGLGATSVTPAQQTAATNAYQNCQASCKGPVNGVSCGDQCQAIYAQSLGIPSSGSGTTNSSGTASTAGCSSAGPSCTINTTGDGTCAQNPESGDFYCKPNPASSSSSSGGNVDNGLPPI